MKRIESKQKAKIIITPNLSSQVTCLHNQVDNGKEWSGLLVSEIVSGSLEDIDNLVIKCHDVFVMDFGDATFTSFEGGEDWVKFFEQFPQVSPLNPNRDPKWFVSKIHSHHSMKAYHSQVDTTDLYENAPKLPFFLSLVVNYACLPFAEIAIAGQQEEVTYTKSNWKLKNWKISNKNNSVKKEKVDVTYIIPCEVNYEEASWFVGQLNAIRNRLKSTPASYTPTTPFKGQTSFKKDYAPSNRMELTPAYTKGLQHFTDLLTLGVQDNKDQPPSQALEQINNHVSISQIEDYKKAFKQYFINEWFEYVYMLSTNVTEVEAIEAVEQFIKFNDRHWISTYIKKALNELKEECNELRTV